MSKPYDIREKLSDANYVAEILKIAGLVEEELDFTLSLYFCAGGRHFDFMEQILSRMTYESKVQLLERLPVRKALKSRTLALEGLRGIQKVRNLVAHPASFTWTKLETTLSHPEAKRLLHEQPAELSSTLRTARRGLYHLTRSKEWKLPKGKSTPSQTDFFLHTWEKRW